MKKTENKLTALENRIDAEINRRFNAGMAVDGTLTITMKTDGRELMLTPCFDKPGMAQDRPVDIPSADYVIVGGKGPAIYMSGNPDDVCRKLAAYDKVKAEWEDDLAKLRAYYEAHKGEPIDPEDNVFDLYSDWHKEVIGYRPNGWEFDRLGNLD